MITPRYMLDTNICIYIRQRRPDAVLQRFRGLRPGEAVISTITYGELRYGAEKSSEQDRALRLLGELLTLLPVQSLSRRWHALWRDPSRSPAYGAGDRQQ